MNTTEIPRHIDDPPQLLLWSADELVPVLLGLVVGIVLDRLLICLGVGAGMVFVYRRFRDNRPDGYLLHLLYWSGLYPSRARGAANPFRRAFYP